MIVRQKNAVGVMVKRDFNNVAGIHGRLIDGAFLRQHGADDLSLRVQADHIQLFFLQSLQKGKTVS